MDYIIRKAVHADIDALIELMGYLISLDGDFPNNREKQRRGFELAIGSGSSEVFVVESPEGKLVGMCSLLHIISTVEGCHTGVVEDVVVLEEYNGLGLAGRMLEFLEEHAKKTGMPRLTLMVDQENIPAVSLYEKHDWERTKYIGYRKYL